MNKRIDFAFIDSGTGGIPYMMYLCSKYPEVKSVYCGDTANFPYGEMSAEDIISCTENVVKLMIDKFNPRAIVIACNTMSVTALDAVRVKYPDVKFIGTVPAVKLAVNITKNKHIGLLATREAITHPYTDQLIKDFASNCTVYRRGDPELIRFIEKKLFTASLEEKREAVLPAVTYFAENNCDTIILACTHFTRMADEIQKVAGASVQVIDSREGVMKQAMRVLSTLLNEESTKKIDNSIHSGVCSNEERVDTLPKNMTFFITELKETDGDEYKELASMLGIPFGGVLSIQ